MSRTNISTGSKWEPIIGYSRAVKVGKTIYVSGTTGSAPDGTMPADLYGQVKQTLINIQTALKQAGAEMKHVVRTRMYLTNIDQWEQAGRAHGEFFKGIMPATAMVEVKRLIDPKMLVEIEADAVIE